MHPIPMTRCMTVLSRSMLQTSRIRSAAVGQQRTLIGRSWRRRALIGRSRRRRALIGREDGSLVSTMSNASK